MHSSRGLVLAVLAGVCAASASLCAKLAMSGEEVAEFCRYLQDDMHLQFIPSCSAIGWFLRLAVFSLIFLFNGLMWTLFTKSLQLCQSSVHATMTNSSSNLIFSGIMGKLLFGETLSLKWWLGTSFIIFGLLLVNRGQQTSENSSLDATSAEMNKKDR